tara:strand:+ start:9634 stop:10296 length:663 start_codon:yes stop_codon:yes gene_type:complete
MTDKKAKPVLSLKVLQTQLEESNQKVEDSNKNVDAQMSEMKGSIAEILKAVSAKNNPTSITKDGAHSEDAYLKLDRVDIEFAKNGDVHADVETVRPGLSSVDTMEFKTKAEQTLFDLEKIEIMVMPSASTYPDHTFFVGVNGRQLLIVRGQKQWLPRNYVEVLLRAKISSYANVERRNNQNELEVVYPETKSHRYPLQILNDRNPLGAKWLMRVANDTRI